MHGGVGDRAPSRAVGHQADRGGAGRRRPPPRSSPSRTMSGSSGPVRGTAATRSTAAMAAAMRGVGGGHDLAAGAVVDLVAVVLRRVVAGGDHHAGGGAEVAHGEGQHRRGQRAGQHVGPDAGGGEHRGGGLGEVGRAVAGVEADRHAPRGATVGAGGVGSQPAMPAAARITTARFMRFGPAPSAPRSPAVPNSRSAANRSARSATAAASPASAAVEQVGQLVAGDRVGVVGDPVDAPGPQVGAGQSAAAIRCGPRSSAMSPPMRSADVGRHRQHVVVGEHLVGQAGGQVGHQRHRQHLGAGVHGGDRPRAPSTCRPGRRRGCAAIRTSAGVS